MTKKQPNGRWVEYDVDEEGGVYTFDCPHDDGRFFLDRAVCMVGFGGVKYADGKSWWPQPCVIMGIANGIEKPLPPTKVRFWVED